MPTFNTHLYINFVCVKRAFETAARLQHPPDPILGQGPMPSVRAANFLLKSGNSLPSNGFFRYNAVTSR
jgi:hypothetical protein